MQAGVGLGNWTAMVKTGRWLLGEMLCMIGERMRREYDLARLASVGLWVSGSYPYVICDYAIVKESMLRRFMFRGSYIEVSSILADGSSVEFVSFRAIASYPARPLLMGQGEKPE